MKELKCPNCNHVFQVDDDVFESLAAQVRNAAFAEELHRAEEQLRRQADADKELALAKKERELQTMLDERDRKLADALAQNRLTTERLKETEERKKLELEAIRRESEARLSETAGKKEAEKANAIAAKDRELADLRAQLNRADDTKRMALLEQQQAAERESRDKENTITGLQLKMEAFRRETEHEIAALKERHSLQLSERDATIELYKNFKARLSTKGIGESLEVHCSDEFEAIRAVAFPNAVFGKDNEVAEGTKGDFIFRDYIDGEEYISIMFEMKNEADNTAAPHRNEEFFAKLHRDRCKKNCEYAVLVTMLEPESELYNKGIVDVSHRYEKMFVIRPQFFISLIGLLTKGARTAFAYKRKLAAKEEENISFVNFRNKILTIQEGIFGNYEKAHASIEKSVKQIDSSIKTLNSLREELLRWEKYMRLASDKAGGLTVKKLTYGNPIVRKAIESAEAASDPESPDISESPLIPSE